MTKVLAVVIGLLLIGLVVGAVVVLHSSGGGTAASQSPSPTASVAAAKCPFTPGQPTDTLQQTDITVGTGAEATASSTVTVKYTGCLPDGTVFDSTTKQGGQPVSFPLSNVIKGWQQGIPGMKVGGTRQLVIPPDLAYGDQANNGIPANSTLSFQVELTDVK